jgi:hypothetical protein
MKSPVARGSHRGLPSPTSQTDENALTGRPVLRPINRVQGDAEFEEA